MGAGGRYKLRIHGVGRAGTSTVFPQAVFALCDSTKTLRCLVPASRAGRFINEKQTRKKTMKIRRGPKMQYILLFFGQHRTIPALRLKHRSGSCGTASALPKCSIMSGCGTRIVLRGQKPLALSDRCPCFGSLFPPLAALTFAASSIICAFGLASAAPRSPYRHLELCGIATNQTRFEKIEKCPLRLGFGRNGRGRRRRCAAAVQGTAGCDIIEETGR